MNKQRRKLISEAQALWEEAMAKASEAKEILEGVRDEKQEAFDNMPENLQSGERGDKAQEAISALEEIIDAADELDNVSFQQLLDA